MLNHALNSCVTILLHIHIRDAFTFTVYSRKETYRDHEGTRGLFDFEPNIVDTNLDRGAV